MLSDFDPIKITQELIRCPSVTPTEAGTLDVLERYLKELGFTCHRIIFSDKNTPDVENLYARWGAASPHLCFAGHVDVVPIGAAEQWSHNPFGADIINNVLYGRGAVDMKGAIACFLSAVKAHQEQAENNNYGSLSFLITCDEEGPGINGTKKLLDWLDKKNEKIDFCLVGEPTNPNKLGDMVKIGRRGSLTGQLTVEGTQGHIAYPHLADNPCHKLVTLLHHLQNLYLDKGTDTFQPSSLQISTIDVGNQATNIIPATAKATFNIRFNVHFTGKSLEEMLRAELDKIANQHHITYQLSIQVSGEAFITKDDKLTSLLLSSIQDQTSTTPTLSTSGGTSDARFIRLHCPVIEFGLVSQTMHKIDECVNVSDLILLRDIYKDFIKRFFETY